MSNFCAFCGKPLPENGVCDCQAQPQVQPQPQPQAQPQPQPQYMAQPQSQMPPQYQAQPQYPPQYQQPQYPPQYQAYPQYPAQPYPPQYQQPAQPSAVGIGFRKLGPFLKAFFSSPRDAIKEVVKEKNLALGLIIVAFFATLSMGAWMTGIVGVHSSASVVLPVVFGMMFPFVIVAMAALSAFLGGKIEKKNVSFVDALTAAGAASILPAAIMFLAILMNLWVYTGLFAFALFVCASIVLYSLVVFSVFELKSFVTVLIHTGFATFCTFGGMLLYLLAIFGDMIYKVLSF